MTALSFTVVVTKCGECLHQRYADRYYCSRYANFEIDWKRVSSLLHAQNCEALTDTGPYACPMLKEKT
jgi:hypothetical protein